LSHYIDDEAIDCVIATGGTGLTGRDVTPEAFRRVFDKEIEGFGEMFRFLSFQKIGTSTPSEPGSSWGFWLAPIYLRFRGLLRPAVMHGMICSFIS
jgi:hypothetical protein